MFEVNETVFICLDGDEQGRNAMLQLAKDVGPKAKIISLPDGMDVNDFARQHSKSEFEALMSDAQDSITYQINQIPEDILRFELPHNLEPVLRELAKMSEAESEGYLKDVIKVRFRLDRDDITAYRSELKDIRKRESEQKDVDNSTKKYPVIWVDMEPLSPAQDFKNGKAMFTVYLTENSPEGLIRVPHVLTSDRECFQLNTEELSSRGLYLARPDVRPSDKRRWSTDKNAENSVYSFLRGEAEVDPLVLFDEIVDLLRQHLEYPDPRYYVLFALWTMGTYLYMLFPSYPYIHTNGPKRSGKTRTMEIIAPLAFNSVMASSLSDAAMYRTVENDRCTLFMDEAAKFSRKNPNSNSERMEIFNSGYKKSGNVTRCIGDEHNPVSFSTYSPKLVANIEGLDPTSRDRTIFLRLQRARGRVARYNPQQLEPLFQKLRNGLYILAMTHHSEIFQYYEKLKPVESLRDREEELWSPILALADFLDQRQKNPRPTNSLRNQMLELAELCRRDKEGEEEDSDFSLRILNYVVEFTQTHEPIAGSKKEASHYYQADLLLNYIHMRESSDYIKKNSLTRALKKLLIISNSETDKKYLRIDSQNRLTSNKITKQTLCYRLDPNKIKDIAERYGVRVSNND